MYRSAVAVIALVLVLSVAHGDVLSAQTCTRTTVRAVVDDTGRALRQIHQEAQVRLDTGLRKLKTRRGWTEDEYLEKGNEFLSDERTEALDAKASELLARLDKLAESAPGVEPDCARLGELEATALELQAAVRSKTRHMLARLDGAVADPPVAAAAAPPAATPPAASAKQVPSTAAPSASPPAPPKAAPAEKTVTAPPVAATPPRKSSPESWSTSTSENRVPAPDLPPTVRIAPAPIAPPRGQSDNEGFSIDEIREASRGLFGTLSGELGGVIEYAFANSGRPTGYILGNEGGGAFIAGVRYGRGTLFTRGGESRDVYWHGPSIGYDFGASGTKTLFLVYRLADPLEIFSGFSGVDGSAFLVGGVGMTLLTDGRLILAPIRTGLGLRLGANIGYVRFTPRPTWNPF